MATTTHYIYSDYNPEDRERLEAETGQLQQESDTVDPWLTEKPFGTSQRLKNPPRFVPATEKYDPWLEPSSNIMYDGSKRAHTDVSTWYKQLTSAMNTPKDGPSRSSSPKIPVQPSNGDGKTKHTAVDKSSWFISRALETQRISEDVPRSSGSSTPTLADLLSREPPPLPSQKPFIPPVYIQIAPTNKGYTMLQSSGWEEGEALGKHAIRRQGLGYKPKTEDITVSLSDKAKGKRKEEIREIVVATNEDGIEEVRRVGVVDLTVSSDEDESHVFDEEELMTSSSATAIVDRSPQDNTPSTDSGHNPRALLTPLPTVLKSDRLGIGLKAKTVGPYRESAKKVTHSQAALAAHAVESEKRRRLKAAVGRGRRGYEKIQKKEEENRKRFLANLNAD